MRNSVIIILILCVGASGYAQRRIKQIEVKEEGASVKISYTPVQVKAEVGGLEISVAPVSPDQLNNFFADASRLDGQFNYSYYKKSIDTYFLRKSRRVRTKSDFDFLMEGLESLEQKEIINQEELGLLEEQIVSDYRDPGFIPETDDFTFANPYLIGQIYLSVFKLEVTNKTEKTIPFNNKVSLSSGKQLLTSLSNSFLTEQLSAINTLSQHRSFAITRFNYNGFIEIPPGEMVMLFISFLPTDFQDNKVQMYLADTSLEWNVNETKSLLDNKYIFYELRYDYETTMGNSLINTMRPYQLLKPSSLQTVGDKIYIKDSDKNNSHEIFGYFFYGNALYYARQQFQPTDYLDFDKKRSRSVVIKVTKLTDVTRKVSN